MSETPRAPVGQDLPDAIISVHEAFQRAGIPHAFGGAIALAYCGTPRATRDIDINVFVMPDDRARVLDALALLIPDFDRDTADIEVARAAQARVRFGATPIDLFFSNSAFHDSMSERVRQVDYVGLAIPVLSAEDLITCKAAFNRPRDWVDIENIINVQRSHIDGEYLMQWLREFYEQSDAELQQIEDLLRKYP